MALTVTSKTTRQQLADELERVQREHAQFKDLVWQVAVEGKENEDWCAEGFRDAMETLGLADRIPPSERVVVLEVLVNAEDSGYNVDDMSDYEWADAALSKLRYSSPGDLESYETKDAPKEK